MSSLQAINPHFEDPEQGEVEVIENKSSSSRDKLVATGVTLGVCAVLGLAIGLGIPGETTPATTPPTASPVTNKLEEYISNTVDVSNKKIKQVIEFKDPDTGINLPGAAVASLQGNCADNNYHFTWVRDSATIHTTVLELYLKREGDVADHKKKLENYVKLANILHKQNENNDGYKNDSLGTAKFTLAGDWVRWNNPQVDGPASRVVLMVRIAEALLELESDTDAVKAFIAEHIFSDADTDNSLQRDMKYIADNREIGYDYEIWEEQQGRHFYNQLVIRRALKMGNDFIENSLGQARIPEYDTAVADIEAYIGATFWNENQKSIIPNALQSDKRLDDIQTTLAVLHAYGDKDGYYNAIHEQVQANVYFTLAAFDDTEAGYTINAMTAENPLVGTALGRYVGDSYNGNCPVEPEICPSPCGGSAWFISVNGMAEYFYKSVDAYVKAGEITITETSKEFFEYIGAGAHTGNLPVTFADTTEEFRTIILQLYYAGESFLRRTMEHASDGVMAEQFNRRTGLHHSAGDLGWSYASFLTAVDAREKVDFDTIRKTYSTAGLTQDVIIHMVDVEAVGDATVSVAVTKGGVCTDVTATKRKVVGEYAQYGVTLSVEEGAGYEIAAFTGTEGCDGKGLITSKEVFEGPAMVSEEPFVIQSCKGKCETTYNIIPENLRDITFTITDVPKMMPNDDTKKVGAVKILGSAGFLSAWQPCGDNHVSKSLELVDESGAKDIWSGKVFGNAGADYAFKPVLFPEGYESLECADLQSKVSWSQSPGNVDIKAKDIDQSNPVVETAFILN